MTGRSSPLQVLTRDLLLLASLFFSALPAGGSEPPSAPPGGVVVWASPRTTRCGLDGETWAPLSGACWFPIDLLRRGRVAVTRWSGGARETATVEISEPPYPVERIELSDDAHVRLSPKDRVRAEREAKVVGALFVARRVRTASFALPLAPPLLDAPPPRNFGTRRFFNGEPRSPHNGADFSAPAGTPVLAAEAGRVVLSADHFFSGKSVFVDHGDGLVSMYFHLSKADVETGRAVARGERIGAVGATGRASGPHLHFGLRWRGARIDPSFLLGRAAPPTVP